MARLPQPGGDAGNWGAILNDYLSQAHTADGSLKSDSVGTAQLQNGSVTATSIASGAITPVHLSSGVRSSLAKADDAYQKPAGGIPIEDLKRADLDASYVRSVNGTPVDPDTGDVEVVAEVDDAVVEAKVAGIKTGPRLHDVDFVMKSPPTVTVETSATLTTGAWYRPRVGGGGAGSAVNPDAPFLYLGVGPKGAPQIAPHPTDSFPWYNSVVSTHKTVTNTNNPTFPIRFVTDATAFEIDVICSGGGGNVRISVDGQVTAEQMLSLPSGERWVKVTGLDGSLHEITVEQYGAAFAGVRAVGATHFYKPEMTGPTAVVFGDSFTSGAAQTLMGYARHLGRHLGIDNLIESGVGGTGYLHPGQGGNVKFRDRLAHDVVAMSPDLVIVAGGRNDGTYSAAAIQAEATEFWSALRTGLPDAVLICVGPYVEQSANLTTWKAVQTAIFAGAQGYADAFIDTLTDPIFTGAGNTSSPAGDGGNADTLINGADLPHPNLAGQNYLADWLTSRIARLLPGKVTGKAVGATGPAGPTAPLAVAIPATTSTVSDTTTETAIFSFTIPANTLKPGVAYRLQAGGTTDNIATSGTLSLRGRIPNTGSYSLGALVFGSQTNAQTNKAWSVTMDVVGRATGASATVAATMQGMSTMPSTGQAQVAASTKGATPGALDVNTAVDNVLTLTAQWATASPGNVIRVDTAILQKLAV